MAGIALPQVLEEPIKGTSLWRDAARRLRRNRAALLGIFLIGLFVFVAILAPLIAPYNPTAGKIDRAVQAAEHRATCSGTDLQGRDILSRIIWGARSSLWVAVLSVSVGLSLGLDLRRDQRLRRRVGRTSGSCASWTSSCRSRVCS